MEKKIKSFSEIKKSGTIVLIDNSLMKDEVATYCGGSENEKYRFIGDYGSSYNFKENDDPEKWSVRIIDKKHPKYNTDMNDFGSFIDKIIKQEIKDVEKKIKS